MMILVKKKKILPATSTAIIIKQNIENNDNDHDNDNDSEQNDL